MRQESKRAWSKEGFPMKLSSGTDSKKSSEYPEAHRHRLGDEDTTEQIFTKLLV